MQSVQSRVTELQKWIAQGKVVEAMSEFYAPDAAMQENSKPPTVGLSANIEREKQFLPMVKEWKGYTVKSIAVDEPTGVATVENVIEFISVQGAPVRMEQVSVQRWRDGKIVHERFYYDTGNN
jgi:ketosteroid isomerase-like protein